MRKATVLVIDDNCMFSKVINATLTTGLGNQYQVMHAQDGEDGLQQILVHAPDIILLDIELPKINGYEVLKMLRASGNATPVIMMTVNSGQWARQKAFEAGCNAYLPKPFRCTALRSHIQELLTKKPTINNQSRLPGTLTKGHTYTGDTRR